MTDAPDSRSAEPVADRYGRPAPWRRTAVIVGSGLVGVLALTWLTWTMFFHATPRVSSELIGWEVVDDHAVTVRVDVDIRDDDISATCRVKALAEDHTVVGEVSFTPEQGPNQVEVRTERRATSVESSGCTAPGQSRPH